MTSSCGVVEGEEEEEEEKRTKRGGGRSGDMGGQRKRTGFRKGRKSVNEGERAG